MMTDILKFTETPLIDEALKNITNTFLLLAPILIMVVISELVLNRETCSHTLVRARMCEQVKGTFSFKDSIEARLWFW